MKYKLNGVTAAQRDDLERASENGELWEDAKLKANHEGVPLTKLRLTWEHCEADNTLVVEFKESDRAYVDPTIKVIKRRLEASDRPWWRKIT